MKNHGTPTQQPVVLAGIGGGIAAYKAVDVISRLSKQPIETHVAMSRSAQQFVTPLTFGAITGNKVLTGVFDQGAITSRDDYYPHLYPSTRADAFVLLPATANIMAKIARGLGDDIVPACALSLPAQCLKFFCPAMNVEMWENEAVQENVRIMESRGWRRLGPDAGPLACGMIGEGRMAEPDVIAGALEQALAQRDTLAGRKVLILSGPTREHFDPVRFIGNASSGKMGKALAEETVARGAEVEFVSGPVPSANLPKDPHIHIRLVTGAEQMLEEAQKYYADADIVIYAAAVADYTPMTTNSEKLPKNQGPLTVELQATPDIARTLNLNKAEDQVVIGFALQSHEGEANARRKLKEKDLDGIVLNYTEAINSGEATFSYLSAGDREQGFEDFGLISKRACAQRILEKAVDALQAKKAADFEGVSYSTLMR